MGSKIKDTNLVLMKMYVFICASVQRKNMGTFSNYTFSNVKTLFASLATHKEKRQSRMPVDLKKTEFAPTGVQAGSSSRTFHPEATGAGGKVQSKKPYRLKRKHLHLHLSFLPIIHCWYIMDLIILIFILGQ